MPFALALWHERPAGARNRVARVVGHTLIENALTSSPGSGLRQVVIESLADYCEQHMGDRAAFQLVALLASPEAGC